MVGEGVGSRGMAQNGPKKAKMGGKGQGWYTDIWMGKVAGGECI
jgi:hypothetical protein